MGEHLSQQMQGTLEHYGAEFILEPYLNFYLATISRDIFLTFNFRETILFVSGKGTRIQMRINEQMGPIIQHSGIKSPL